MATERIMSRSSSSCSDIGSVQEELDNGKRIIEKLPMDNDFTKSMNNKNNNNSGSVDNINTKNKSKDGVGLKKKLKSSKKTGRRNPERFLGDGVSFKAKLFGSHDVPQARGEKMAQEALQELKTQKKLSGEHKRRITINIALDGLRIREEKKKEVLYFHAVHKISFISQDPTDNRAFGYIYGSPDNVHTFFAIKTEKMAHQIVMCMRDLFQIAFELKKREIEQWRQQQLLSTDNKTGHGQSTSLGTDSNDGSTVSSNSHRDTSSPTSIDSSNSGGQNFQFGSSAFDNGRNTLVDFNAFGNKNQRLNDKLVPLDVETLAPNVDNFFDDPWEYMKALSTSEDVFDDNADPFGLELESSNIPMTPTSPVNDPFNTNFIHAPFVANTSTPCIPMPVQSPSPSLGMLENCSSTSAADIDRYAALAEISVEIVLSPAAVATDDVDSSFNEIANRSNSAQEPDNIQDSHCRSTLQPDLNTIFSELDPLGKDRPYVDKKDFFFDVKNPPKKVLNDLMPKNSFPMPDFEAISDDDKIVSKDFEMVPPSTSLPPPPVPPPPFIRRPRLSSPSCNLADALNAAEIPRPNSRSSLSTSLSSSSFSTVPEVYLPPPPPPPPRPQHHPSTNNVLTTCYNSSVNKTGCRDSVYSSSGSSDGSSSPTGEGPCNSSSIMSTTAPIPIPNRRGIASPPPPSSASSSGISSTNNSGSFDYNVIEQPFTKWNVVTPTTILSPPPPPVSANPRRPNSSDQLSCLSYNNNNDLNNRQLQRTNVKNANIFRKEEDPFNDDDFFSALRPNGNPFR